MTTAMSGGQAIAPGGFSTLPNGIRSIDVANNASPSRYSRRCGAGETAQLLACASRQVLMRSKTCQSAIATARSTSRVMRPASMPKTCVSMMSRAVAPTRKYSTPSLRQAPSKSRRMLSVTASTGRSARMLYTGDRLLANGFCDFEISRVEAGHQVGEHKRRRREIGLLPVARQVPEGVEYFDCALRVRPQAVSRDQSPNAALRSIGSNVECLGRRLEHSGHAIRCNFAAPPCVHLDGLCVLPPIGIGRLKVARMKLGTQLDWIVGGPLVQ